MEESQKYPDYKKYKFRELKVYGSTEWLADNKKKYRGQEGIIKHETRTGTNKKNEEETRKNNTKKEEEKENDEGRPKKTTKNKKGETRIQKQEG